MTIGLRFARWLASKLGQPRIIYGGTGTDKYLSRYYILGSPRNVDMGAPFDENGDPKDNIQWSRLPFGIYLHRFHRSDEDRELHNHPWRFAVSLILSGGYLEERRLNGILNPIGKMFLTRFKSFLPGMFNVITSNDFHRVDLIKSNTEETWSLFFVGPKFQGWGFWNKVTDTFTPWRKFLSEKREAQNQRSQSP